MNDVFAGILVGGRGTRLGGVDKAGLTCGATTFLGRLIDTVRPHVAAVYVAARPGQAVVAPGCTVVRDRSGELGPMGGLQTLLQQAPTAWCWLLAVDLVALPGDSLAALAAARRPDSLVVAPYGPYGPEPCAALYHRGLLPRIEAALGAGQRALHRLIAAVPHALVTLPAAHLLNINEPADLQELRAP
jgi:molybdopterin-guanine dinucleotide biosynthesis protein A